MNWIDTHAHIDDSAFDGNREELIASFKESGVAAVIDVGADTESSKASSELSKKYDFFYSAVGVHPEFAETRPENYLDILRGLVKSNPKIKAIGEIGLDYHYEGYNAEAQKRMFEEQMALARELSLPAVIHSRDASAETLEIVRKYPDVRKVIHCFSGSAETAKEIIAMGDYISFTGVITFKNAKKFVGIIENVPLDRIFFETDSPYLSPEPVRGKVNDPRNVKYIIEKAAEIKNMDTEELCRIANENAKRFFNI